MTWTIVAVAAVIAVAVVAYILIKQHIDRKNLAATLQEHGKKTSAYLEEKQKNEVAADKKVEELLPEKQAYSKEAAESFLERTKKPWPPSK